MTKANKPITGRWAIHDGKRMVKVGMKRPATKTDSASSVVVRRPGGAIVAHAWTRGGSHHRPAKGKALGCHPREFKTKWSTKKGMGTPIA
jgi:hypothetical protein